ncbi:MAG: anthranilate phosphoribosyltransferase [Verrucomicrobiae bacterium]|nr:anthranilate phosphoribosyltransferase [Verrucomicrobiae bacterium]
MSVLRELTAQLENRRNLDTAGIHAASEDLANEDIDSVLKEGFLTAWSRKGETAEEIAALSYELRKKAINPGINLDQCGGRLIDVVGTGSDRAGTINISTAAVIVVAAAGIAVAKHGNRSITSKCGSADVLEALGVPIHQTPEKLRQCVHQKGIGFIYAPNYHPAFKAIAPVRKKLAERGQSTVFNIMGPLLNPAPLTHQLAGVAQESLLEKYAQVLALLGRKKAWVVHGRAGDQPMDEISTLGPTLIAEIKDGRWRMFEENFRQYFSVPNHDLEDLAGGDARTNAHFIESVLRGEDVSGKTDIILANAAAAIYIAGKSGDFMTALAVAREMIWSGKAFEKLEQWRNFN